MNRRRKLGLASFLFLGLGLFCGTSGAWGFHGRRDGQINFDVFGNLTALSGQDSVAGTANASARSAQTAYLTGA
jgi:hypothetical protein